MEIKHGKGSVGYELMEKQTRFNEGHHEHIRASNEALRTHLQAHNETIKEHMKKVL